MYTAIEIAKFIISYCTDIGSPISNLKLQKILYYLQVYFIKNGHELFKEDIYAWQYGPVIPAVYYMFSGYGASKIQNSYQTQIDGETAALLIPIIEKLCNVAPWDLVNMTHAAGGPWDLVYNNHFEPNGIIDKQLLLKDTTDLGVY